MVLVLVVMRLILMRGMVMVRVTGESGGDTPGYITLVMMMVGVTGGAVCWVTDKGDCGGVLVLGDRLGEGDCGGDG